MSRLYQAIEEAARLKGSAKGDLRKGDPAAASPRPPSGHGRDQLLQVAPLPVAHSLIAGWNGQNEEAGEEYRKLRSVLMKLTRGEAFHNTLLVTSTISGEGKTLTAINLALALAQEHDHTVLLVDTDLRKPAVHRYLGLNPEVGLSHCLKDGVPVTRALVKTGLGKLVVLPAGEAIDNPVEHLASSRMKAIIRELKTRYPDRYVIFDSPPVLPVADAQVLAEAVDSVLFVVREGGPNIGHVAEALKSVQGTRLLGVVYNDAESFGGREYYYKYS